MDIAMTLLHVAFLALGCLFFVGASVYYYLAVRGAVQEQKDKKQLYDHLMKNVAVVVQRSPRMDA